MTARREFSSIKPGVLLERTEQSAQGPGAGEATLWQAATGGELRSSSSSIFLTIRFFRSCVSIAEKVALVSGSSLCFLFSIITIIKKIPQTTNLVFTAIILSYPVGSLSSSRVREAFTLGDESTCSLFDQRTPVQGLVKPEVPPDSQES